MTEFRKAQESEFEKIKAFYWKLIEKTEKSAYPPGWKKGIYPTDEFLKNSLKNGELYVLEQDGEPAASVIVNSEWNEGYNGAPWSLKCRADEILVPHALGVAPSCQHRGIGKAVVADVLDLARKLGKKSVRLDILGTNYPAEKLYTSMGFRFVQAKEMFYEDTGYTEYRMFELNL